MARGSTARQPGGQATYPLPSQKISTSALRKTVDNSRIFSEHSQHNMQVQRQPGLPFILVTVFLDTLSFGFVIPILPALVATMTPDKQSQAYWYGLLLGSFGLAQFFSAPL